MEPRGQEAISGLCRSGSAPGTYPPIMVGRPQDETPPLQRHAALRPLSREHMGGLVQARRLRRAADGTASERRSAIDDFVALWSSEIRDHFDDEERLLLSLIDQPELRARLVHEHRVVRGLASLCESKPASAIIEPWLVRCLGDTLHDHIRWEERELFESIQRAHGGALRAMLGEAAAIERRRPGSRARCRLVHRNPPTPAGVRPMSDDRARQPPSERFDSPCLMFDLQAEAAAIRQEATPARQGHRQKALYKHAGRTIALFVMEAGAMLPEHAAAGTVSIQVIEGELSLDLAGRDQALRPGQVLVLQPGTRHDVRATTSAVFLLQISLGA